MNLSNPQFIFDRARSDSLITKRTDGADTYVSAIESLENTGISATQGTDNNQLLLDGNGNLRTLLDGEALRPVWMNLPQSVLGAESLTAQYVVTMRFMVLVLESTNPWIFGNRNDNLASFSLESRLDGGTTTNAIRVTVGESSIWSSIVHPINEWVTLTVAVDRDADQARFLLHNDTLRETTGLGSGDRYQQNRIFGTNSRDNKQMLFSHAGAWNTYPTQQEFEDLHAWVQDEMPLGTTLTITKSDGVSLVPEGTYVQHMYADDNKGTNETELEVLNTNINGEISIDEDLLPAGKVRFIRTIYRENGIDAGKEQFFTD